MGYQPFTVYSDKYYSYSNCVCSVKLCFDYKYSKKLCSLLRLRDFCQHGHNNDHVVKKRKHFIIKTTQCPMFCWPLEPTPTSFSSAIIVALWLRHLAAIFALDRRHNYEEWALSLEHKHALHISLWRRLKSQNLHLWTYWTLKPSFITWFDSLVQQPDAWAQKEQK